MDFKLKEKRILAFAMCLVMAFSGFAAAEAPVYEGEEMHATGDAADEAVVSGDIEAPVAEMEPTDLFVLAEMAEIIDPEADLDIDINDGCDVHVFDSEGVCMSCGKACTHPEEECEDLNIPIAYAQLNDLQHNVTYEVVRKCWACGMTVEETENTFTSAEDHFDWARECDCGYINENFVEEDGDSGEGEDSCTHPDMEESLYWEYADCVSYTDEDHEILWMQMSDRSCPDCDYESTRPTGKTVVRISAHNWDADGAGFCNDCPAWCKHPATMQQNYWDEECEALDADSHSVVRTLYARVRCLECQKTYSVKTEDRIEYTEGHLPGEDGYCEKCGCEMPESGEDGCAHAVSETGYVFESADIRKGDQNGHVLSMEAYATEICTECGEEISSENRVRDESRDYTVTEPHEWTDNSEIVPFGDCAKCGFENTCKHGKAAVNEVNISLNYSDITETTHDGVGIVVEIFDCPDCKWRYTNATGKTVSEQDEPHAFENGVCACGYNCVHSRITEEFVDISRDYENHTTLTTTVERCEKCDVVFSEVPVSVTGVHTFENDKCTYCGFDGIQAIQVPENMEMGVKESRILPTTYLPETAENNITYVSSKPSVVKVNAATGKMTAKKTGTAEITAYTEEGAAAVCTVTVKKAPTGVKASVSKKTLGVGETFTIAGKISSKTASAFSYSSSRKSVATVDENGLVTAVKAGTAKIYVKTFNGKKAVCTVTVKPAPEVVSVTPSEAVLSEGQTAKLTTRLTTSAGKAAAGAYAYSLVCEPEGCASLENGVLTADKAGKVTVTATTYLPDVKGSAEITILPAPDRAELDIEGLAVTLGVKETLTLRPTIANGSPADFTFTTDKKSVATVSKTGKITAKKKGTAVITATPHRGEPVSVAVTVVSAPKRVKLSAKKLTLGVGEETTLKATLSSGSASALKWKSSRTGVVEVDQNGVLTPKKAGKATITVTTFNKKKATCTVTVKAAPEVVTVTSSKSVMSVGQTAKLTTRLTTLAGGSAAGAYTYTVEPADCVTLEKGVLSAKVPGTVTVTATTYKDLAEGSVTIEIKDAPDAVIIGGELTLGVNETFTLNPVIANGSPADLTYSSDKKSVATVSKTGKITAKKRGTAVITVTANGLVSETVTVTVKAAPKGVRLSAKTLNLNIGDSVPLTATVTSGASNTMKWKSSRTSVVTVKNGVLSAVGAGTATVTVTTFNGKKASCKVNVAKPASENVVINVKGSISAGGNRIGMLWNSDAALRQETIDIMHALAAERGVELQTLDADTMGSAAVQTAMAEKLLLEGIVLLAVDPVNSAAAEQIQNLADSCGVYLTFFNSDPGTEINRYDGCIHVTMAEGTALDRDKLGAATAVLSVRKAYTGEWMPEGWGDGYEYAEDGWTVYVS